MTHHQEPDLLNTVLQLLTSQGSANLAECFRLLRNEAMHQERSAALQAQPYVHCEGRLGHANGFKPKALATRMGAVELRIPQVRDGIDFYPSALERGDGGRGFGFTGGHFHLNWGNADFRKVVLNALVWVSGAEVPEGGVVSSVASGQLFENLDPKPEPKKKVSVVVPRVFERRLGEGD